MQFHDLKQLLQNSSSSRRYFLTLPVELQLEIHQYNHHIHNLHQLHQYVDYLKKE